MAGYTEKYLPLDGRTASKWDTRVLATREEIKEASVDRVT